MQFDPALKQFLLVTTGSPLGEAIAQEIASREVPVVARLADAALPVGGLNVTSRFDPIVTGRVRLDQIVTVHQDPNVASLKASTLFGSMLASSVPEIRASGDLLRAEFPPDGMAGRGVVIGFADWGCDFAHLNLRDRRGATRLLAVWDQRGGLQPESPQPFGYGRAFGRQQIDAALTQPDPYAALGYDPAQSDPECKGTHATHVMDIAAGSGLAPGASPGVAPEADLVFVHLRGDDTDPRDTLGDSVRVLEAVRYILDCAGERPVVINLSLGRTGGPHDDSPLVTQALDALSAERPGRAVVMSTGNYFAANLHSGGQLRTGESADLRWTISRRNDEIVEMEVWYSSADQLSVELIDPANTSLAVVPLGEDHVVRDGDRIIASIFHRQHDPNNSDHQIDLFLWPDAPFGTWTTRLHGEAVTDGTFHGWIERAPPELQARFVPESASAGYTTGTICNGRKTISVGAYDARQPTFPLGPFSSAGPTRDGRAVPTLSAPGVAIRAARSSCPTPEGRLMHGLTVMSGTSMAAPHVSGVIALMFEAAGEQRLSIDQTRDILVSTARPEPADPEYQRYGAGRVDAVAAVQQVLALRSSPEVASISRTAAAPRKESSDVETQTEVAPATELSELPAWADAESCDEGFGEVGEWTEATAVPNPLQRRLAAILPALLVDYADAELQRRDQAGNLAYDKSQPVFFRPNGRVYTVGPGRFTYHAADLVYNSAYDLGYDVPVFPLHSSSASDGEAYLNLAATFRALAESNGNRLRPYLERFFEVVAQPGEPVPPTLRAGDLLLRGAGPEADYGHLAVIVDPEVRCLDDPLFLSREPGHARGVHCISAGLAMRDREARHGCALADATGQVLSDRMVIRFKESAVDAPRAAARLESDPDYRQRIEHAHWMATSKEAAEVWPEPDIVEAVVDSTVAVPPFNTAKRALISTPLQDPARSAAAITWNASKHPTVSGVAPEEIRSALASYVDLAAVGAALDDYNAAHPGTPIAAGSAPIDAVLVEAVHQFQAKCFAEPDQVDGKAGESTLDSLGFVKRTGLNSIDRANRRAQGRLDAVDAQIRAATGGTLTAAGWFENMVNPSFLGWRFTKGIHVVLARKLRTAENSLLAQAAYSGMTPIELGRALGIDEQHKGARPSANSNSMHTFGLAVDIRYGHNPWVAGQHVARSNGAITAAGQATQRANQELTRAVNRAALLISGADVDFTPAYLSGLRGNSTAVIFDTIQRRSDDLTAYLRLRDDLAGIQAKIAEYQGAGTADVINAGETLAEAATRWQTRIAEDLSNLRRNGSNFSGRNPLNGFLNLNRDLVIALRDTAGLAWGAVDLGGESGDMMHFDDRRTGVGRIAHDSR